MILIVPFALSFAQTIKQLEPAPVGKPVSWLFTLRASSASEKGFRFPIPASAFNVTLKTVDGVPVKFVMQGSELVCAACDLSKRDYVIRLETPAAVLIEQGWVKNEAASTSKQEFWSQRETAFNPSEFNYKNVQGFLVCGGDFVCSISSNGGNPFFKIDSLKSKAGVDFTVTAIKTKTPAAPPSPVPSVKASLNPSPASSPTASAEPIKATPLIIPLEDYVAQTQAANVMPQASPAVSSPVVELPEIPALEESDVVALLNVTQKYSFGLASVTGNDFPANESSGAWRVFASENVTAFELNFSFINSSGADPQRLFLKTRFYNSSALKKTRVEITFESELCVSCFAWLKAKTFDSSLNELGEDDVFFNSEAALSDSTNTFLFKPIGWNETNQSEGNESFSVRKIVAEFDSSNSSFARFFLTAYSVDGNYSGLLKFEQPSVTPLKD
ncbi:hypothetical protein H0N96_02110 [Candidatus Micrarchaeota archaeon]|nr:hypothetical protein [Candidatus Micrarchaeota archaeon]